MFSAVFRRMVSPLALVLLCAAAAESQARPRFAIGATRSDVRVAQGEPAVIERLPSLALESWTFGAARVRFNLPGGAVTGWDDPRQELHVDFRAAGAGTGSSTISLGAPAADVLRIHGAPRAVSREGTRELWSYGNDVVVLDTDDRRVSAWRNREGHLHALASQAEAAERAFSGTPASSVPSPGAPPDLTLTVTLADTTAEARSAGSSNAFVVKVTNHGAGTAYSVLPSADFGPARAALMPRPSTVAPIAALASGASATRRLAFEIDVSASDTTLVATVSARDANGFEARDVRYELPVLAMRGARFILDELRIDDQSGDGRLSPREIADVTARVRNAGSSAAHGAHASLSLSHDVFVVAGTPPRFELGTLAPGASVDVTFSVYSNSRPDSMAVSLDVQDASRRAASRLPIRLPLEHSTSSVSDPRVLPSASGRARAAVTRLTDDVDRELGGRVERNPDAIAVVVGIDRYRSLPPARYAARDALTMRRYLIDALGVPDDREHLYVRVDADATGNEFRKIFGASGWLARRAQPQSDIVVYFAGHGASTADRSPLLMPWDADLNYPAETSVALSEIYAALAKLPARTITVFLDACFSGTTRDGAPLAAGTRPVVVSIEHPALLRPGMAVFAAAQGAQPAGDLPEQRHGLFSVQLFRALRGAADGDADRAITVAELESYLTREVAAAAGRQDREQRPLVIAKDRARVVSRLPATGSPR